MINDIFVAIQGFDTLIFINSISDLNITKFSILTNIHSNYTLRDVGYSVSLAIVIIK